MYPVPRLQNKQINGGLQKGMRRRDSRYWKGVYRTLRISSKTALKFEDLEVQLALKNAELSGSMISNYGSQWNGKNVQTEIKFKKLGRLHNLISKDDQIRSRTTPKKLNKSYVKIARKMRMFFPKGIVERALYECLHSEVNRGTSSKQRYVAVFLGKIEENLSRIKRSLRVHDEKWWAELSEYFGCQLNYNVVMKQMDRIPPSSNEMKFYVTCKRFNDVFDRFKHEYEVTGDALLVAENLKDIFLENYGKPGFICRNGDVEGKVRGLLALAIKITDEKRSYIKQFATKTTQTTALKKIVKRLQKSLSPFISEEQDLFSKKKGLKKREELQEKREEKEKLADELKSILIREAGRTGILLKKTDLVNKGIYIIYGLMEKIRGKENVRNVRNKALSILVLTLREAGMGYDSISNLIGVDKKKLYQRIFYLKKQLERPIKARKRHFCHVCKTVIEAGETYCYGHKNTKVHLDCRKKNEKQEKGEEKNVRRLIEPASCSYFEKNLEKFEEDEKEKEGDTPLIYAYYR